MDNVPDLTVMILKGVILFYRATHTLERINLLLCVICMIKSRMTLLSL